MNLKWIKYKYQLAGSELLMNRSMQFVPPLEGEIPDIMTISGDNPEENIARLLEPLGGIGLSAHRSKT